MPHFLIDDQFSDSKEVLAIPARHRLPAVGLFTLMGAWSANKLLDGFVPDEKLRQLGGRPALVCALAEIRGPEGENWALIARVPGGVRITNWAKWQRTREQVVAFRSKQAEKKQKQRAHVGTVSTSAYTKMSPGDTPECPGGSPPTPKPKPKRTTSGYVNDEPLRSEPRAISSSSLPAVSPTPPLPVDADVPDHIDNAARPAKRFASEAAKTLVRQELGSGYPRQAVERLAVQVDDLARQRPPIADQHIRAAVREWDTRPDCRPEWLPTVCSDVVKRSRALDVNGRHQPGINQPGIGKPTQKAAGYADAAARIIAQMENR